MQHLIAKSRLEPIVWIVGLGTCLGFASQSCAFWIVGALVQAGSMNVAQATLMPTAEYLAIGFVMLLLTPRVHRLPHKRLIAAGIVVVLIAQLLSTVSVGLWTLASVRVISGIGFGVIYSIVSALGASARDPDRAYSAGGIVSLAFGTLLNPTIGYGSEHYGVPGVFLGLAAFCLLLAIPLLLMPFPAVVTAPVADLTQGVTADQHAHRLPASFAVGVLCVMSLFALATNGVYVFIERVADSVGLRGVELGTGLTIVSMLGAIGVALAGRAQAFITSRAAQAKRTQFTRAILILSSLSIMGVLSAALILSNSAAQFYICFTLWVIVYWLAYTHIFALAVAADPLGRLASATGATLILLGGVGSGSAGYMALHFGLNSFAAFALIACIVSAVGAVAVYQSTRRHQQSPATESNKA